MLSHRPHESGSAIYWIFIMVALFAALSFAVANINRGGGNGKNNELYRAQATEIIQYAGVVQRAIRAMKINGVDESELCFHTDQWGHTDYEFNPPCATTSNRIFSFDGGGVNYQGGVPDWYNITTAIDATVQDEGEWVFSSRFEVQDSGTDGGTSDTESASADLIMATAPVRIETCEAINLLLGFEATPVSINSTVHDELTANKFDGTFSDNSDKIDISDRERCVEITEGAVTYHMYYKVILAR